ncbi:hypothetical protein CONCODRAFT_12805 [Conidiobolus coronatus NRRL 28638]|uniref:Uncharacterized protein n=1 Tax=Conidiobolus coronatus (strain ATCC 28846 / CBS 209.66 / NRRL 28638) TaxID=796925 RepID=A0A137NS28_CONC2|nr:hypothetical protein CONCODRAFT_12805 [Conidiobolus coronatus NRRL 28638]|eukprot:KXN65573.1 hypothetical protein CONCODRAFT_12805 [Conidiobolus coronatus NRRL 28638]
MKLYTIFLATAAFAKKQITIHHIDGSSKVFDATPGDCRALSGTPINNIFIPIGIVVKFFDDEGCKGNQLGFGIREYFHPYERPSKIKSIKVLNGPGHKSNNLDYYYNHMNYVGRFYSSANI